MGLEMPPHILDRIEFGRIGWQPLDAEASPGGGNVVLDQATAMNGCAVPDDQQLSWQVPLEVFQKFNHLEAFDAAGMNLEVETPEGQTADDREAFPIESFVQDRRLPTKCPGAHPRWAGAQSAFVNKDEGAALLPGLFFNVGQPTRFHCRIAFGLRSIARRSGRWQLKPLAPSKRQT